MPKISTFYGIIIFMYFDDHNPPHFHAEYNGNSVMIKINDLSVLQGSMPSRALGMIVEWAYQHRDELVTNWERMTKGEVFNKIDPLK